MIDARGIPTHECPQCGHDMFWIVASFSEYEIAGYGTEGRCDNCGSLVTVPTLIDSPEYEQ